jgi:hypothetical protein
MRERLEFAQCMRDNGVKDFPDPTRDGPLIDTTRIPSAAERGALDIPGFQAAMEKCRDVLAEAVGASEAQDVGAGRSGRPGCRDRHGAAWSPCPVLRKRPRPHRSRRRTP